jgi:CRP/FNR family transcriptional regulator, anaerobic regulatory protein
MVYTVSMIRELPELVLPGASLDTLKASCATCSMHQLCLPMGLDNNDMDRLDRIIGRRRKVARGAPLFRIGDAFQSLYAIRLGHFKTYQVNREGADHRLPDGGRTAGHGRHQRRRPPLHRRGAGG